MFVNFSPIPGIMREELKPMNTDPRIHYPPTWANVDAAPSIDGHRDHPPGCAERTVTPDPGALEGVEQAEADERIEKDACE